MNDSILRVLCFSFFAFSSSVLAETKFYDFAYANDKSKKEITLRFDEASVNKYPGWRYRPNKAVNVSIWFPSLKEASSPNVWMSSKQEQEKSNIKPNDNNRKLSLKLGGIVGNYLVDPTNVNGQSLSECKTKQTFEKYIKEGELGIFKQYKSVGRPGAVIKDLFVPSKPISGIGCIKCNGATCQLFGISDIGIEYIATEAFKESQMVNDVVALHQVINQYIESKRVKD